MCVYIYIYIYICININSIPKINDELCLTT